MTRTSLPGELITSDYMLAVLRNQAKGFAQLGVGQNALARRIGVSNGYLSRVLRGDKEPGPKVLSYFGFEVVTRYQMALSDTMKRVKR